MKQSKLFFSGIIVSLLAGFAVQPAAEAFSSADLAAVTGGQNCPHADLSHANLSGADLTGLDLTGANLEPDRSQAGADHPGQSQPAGLQTEAGRLFRSPVVRRQF